MSANTTVDAVRQRAQALGLSYLQTSRLIADEHRHWRNYTEDLHAALELHELLVVLVLSPAQINTLFPRLVTNVFSLGNPRMAFSFRNTAWQRMASLLASTGFLALVHSRHQIPRRMARTIAVLCSGIHFYQGVHEDVVFPLAAKAGQKSTRAEGQDDEDEEVEECIDHTVSLFNCTEEERPPFLLGLKQSSAYRHSIDMAIPAAAQAIWSTLGIEAGPGPCFWTSATGIFDEDVAACAPVGSGRMLVAQRYSLEETNIRAALRLGLRIPELEAQTVDRALLRYVKQYFCGGGPDVADESQAAHEQRLFDFYAGMCAPELASKVPRLLSQARARYAWSGSDFPSGEDVLEKVTPRGSVVRGEPVDSQTVLTALMNCFSTTPAPPGIVVSVVLGRMELDPVAAAKAIESKKEATGGSGLFIVAGETPDPPSPWIDRRAWDAVLRFPVERSERPGAGRKRRADFFLDALKKYK